MSDVPLLAQSFLDRSDRPTMKLTDAGAEALKRHTWPGNVRELVNVIERIVTLTDGDDVTEQTVLFALSMDHEYKVSVEPETTGDLVKLTRQVSKLTEAFFLDRTPQEMIDQSRSIVARTRAMVAQTRRGLEHDRERKRLERERRQHHQAYERTLRRRNQSDDSPSENMHFGKDDFDDITETKHLTVGMGENFTVSVEQAPSAYEALPRNGQALLPGDHIVRHDGRTALLLDIKEDHLCVSLTKSVGMSAGLPLVPAVHETWAFADVAMKSPDVTPKSPERDLTMSFCPDTFDFADFKDS